MTISRFVSIGCVAIASLSACRKPLTVEAIETSPAAIAQEGRSGKSTWIVAPDGAVSAALPAPAGKPAPQAVTGQVTFAPPGAEPTAVPVQYDPKSGVLTAAGPKLDADITPVSYALTVDGAPWKGSIDVPRGGTRDLVDTGKLQVGLPPGTRGPNGGVVQLVGPDRVEVVGSKGTGDVRAYVLDADNRPVDPGDRKVTLALQGEAPEVVMLEPEPQAHFLIGHLRTRIDPVHVTVAVRVHGTTHACLFGWAPGSVVVMGPEAPRVHLMAVEAWPGEVVEVRGKHGHFRGDVVVGAPAVGVEVEAPGVAIGGPSVVVGGPSVVLGGPSVVVGGPGVAVGAQGGIGGPGVIVEHDRDHDRGRHEHGEGRHGR